MFSIYNANHGSKLQLATAIVLLPATTTARINLQSHKMLQCTHSIATMEVILSYK